MTQPPYPADGPPIYEAEEVPPTCIDLGPMLRHLLQEIAGLPSRGLTAPMALTAAVAPATLMAPEPSEVRLRELADGLAMLRGEMHQNFQALLNQREAEQQAVLLARQEAAWQAVVFGPELGRDDRLRPQRQALVESLLRADAAALGLAGHLMVFQSAPPDRLPNLLKDVGEAYYRWRPRAAQPDPLESALTGWLERRGDAAGLRNRIELVDPGCRFNPAKHRTAGTGVEVTEVHGWVVLRADGVVFHKASVSVR